MSEFPIALQLYTVRDRTARDFVGTLHEVSRIGYGAVEFAGYGDLPAARIASILAETEMQAAASHVGYGALRADLEREVAYCLALNCRYLVLPGLPLELQDDPEALAPDLDRMGARCREHGITFAYHNHDWELRGDFLQRLLAATDPTLVRLELDTFWVAYAGLDPVTFMREHADRVSLVHLKGMTQDRSFTEIGEGILPFQPLLEAGREIGVAWYIVENDEPRPDSLESARRSLANIQAVTARE